MLGVGRPDADIAVWNGFRTHACGKNGTVFNRDAEFACANKRRLCQQRRPLSRVPPGERWKIQSRRGLRGPRPEQPPNGRGRGLAKPRP